MPESDWTPTKRKEARKVIAATIGIFTGWFKKWPGYKFVYYDLNAGDGGTASSRSTCLEVIGLARDLYERFQIPYDIRLFENGSKNKEYGKQAPYRLESLMGEYWNEPDGCSIKLFKDDNELILEQKICKRSLGIVYADPNGGCSEIKTLIQLSQNPFYQHIDFLMNINPASVKRVEGGFHYCSQCGSGNNLESCLRQIEKRHLKIRERFGRWQWTLAYFSNSSIFENRWRNLDGKQKKNRGEIYKFFLK